MYIVSSFAVLIWEEICIRKRGQKCYQLDFENEDVQSFWDAGANIGYYSLLISSLLPDSEIIAFDPFTKNINLLTRTINFTLFNPEDLALRWLPNTPLPVNNQYQYLMCEIIHRID